MNTVLIIGSAPDAVRAKHFDCTGVSAIVAINNAWRIREDWTHLVCPEDFPIERRPTAAVGQQFVEYDRFVPANNSYGGVVYAGGTMAFTAGYWVLHALKPDIMFFLGCDMIYDQPDGDTHFYGTGEADPLRDDPTLQSLEAKSNRLFWKAFEQQCLCLNLSSKTRSRLTFDTLAADFLGRDLSDIYKRAFTVSRQRLNRSLIKQAEASESELNCFIESGAYWQAEPPLDADKLAAVDRLWFEAINPPRVE